jgi:glycosidase
MGADGIRLDSVSHLPKYGWQITDPELAGEALLMTQNHSGTRKPNIACKPILNMAVMHAHNTVPWK